MGTAVEPELYLRLACERALGVDRRSGAGVQTVGAVARALLAADLLQYQDVERLIQEYALAAHLRPAAPHLWTAADAEQTAEPLAARRVVLGPVEVASDQGPILVEKIVLSETETRLDAAGVGVPRGAHLRRRGNRGLFVAQHPHPPAIAVTDDRGTTSLATAQGWGSSDRMWNASMQTAQPLAMATEWLDIDGTRVQLPRQQPAVEVRVEPVQAASRLRAALLREAVNGLGGREALDEFLAALEATAGVGGDAEEVIEARGVAAVLDGAGPVGALGPPWDSVFGRLAAVDGPVGAIAAGAAVGDVDGCNLVVDALRSEEGSFVLDVAVSPPSIWPGNFPGLRLRPDPIVWWAEDDRENVYLGLPGRFRGSATMTEGEVRFLSALDPRASEIRVLPTGWKERASFRFALDSLGASG